MPVAATNVIKLYAVDRPVAAEECIDQTSTEGWFPLKISSSPEWGIYQGPYGAGETVAFTVKNNCPAGNLPWTIEFDFYRFDSWDGELFKVTVNGVNLISEQFCWGESFRNPGIFGNTAVVDGYSVSYIFNSGWQAPVQANGIGWTDERFSVVITVPHGIQEIELSLWSTLGEDLNNESWGIGNFAIRN